MLIDKILDLKTIDGEGREFYFTTKLSDNIEILENGYMRCNNVIMGRTGSQRYTTKELGIETTDGKVHIIDVNRHEEDVFHPETLKSIEGKPLTIGHPRNDDGSVKFVTVDNVDELRVGYILNVRRDEDNIVGDIIIEDKEAIDLVRNKGIKELSLGYLPKYQLDGDDSLKQTNIVINHLALVSKGRAGNARIVDEANQEIEEGQGEKHLEKDTLFTKFLRVLGVKKAVLDDDTEISVVDEVVKVEEEKSEEVVIETKTEDEQPKVEEEVVAPTGDDSTRITKTTVEEKNDTDYYEETRKTVVVEEQTFHSKTDEEIEKEKAEKEKQTVKITFDEAMAKITALETLKGTEAYEKQIATIDADMVESGLGSILKKADGNKVDIFGTVVPQTKQTGDEDKTPKFKGNDFVNGIKAVYAQFTPKALNKVSRNTVDRAMHIKELSSVDARDLIK